MIIIANKRRMQQVPQDIVNFFSGIVGGITNLVSSSMPEGLTQVLLFIAVASVIVGVVLYLSSRKSDRLLKSDQNTIFGPTLDSLAQRRKGVDDYLKEKIVQASVNNWVLFNFAPLTVFNAGYMGPADDGLYDPEAIRRALDLGFRCFVFHIDYYQGAAKDTAHFVPPGEPCLLHRDNQGVIRSRNCGRIDQMIRALAEQAFSPSMPTGRDPLIVILDFKNVPDQTKSLADYTLFLKKVSKQIQPLRNSFLARLGDTRFSSLENPALLFTQNFQALRGKTIIFTNVNTDVFSTPEAANTPIEQNLRSMINAQMYSLSADALPLDTVTEIAPKGTMMSVGRQNADYFLLTPPDKIKEAQLKTNNVFTLINAPDANGNHKKENVDKLMNTYGAQMLPFNLFVTPAESEEYLNTWGAYSWRLKPAELQYVVVRAEPPLPISIRADANGGNVAPPALHL